MDFRDNIIKYEKFDERLKNRDYSKYVGDLFRFTEPKSLHTLACLNESLNKVEPFYEKNGLIDERTWAFDKTSTSFAIGGIIDEHYFNLELKQYLKDLAIRTARQITWEYRVQELDLPIHKSLWNFIKDLFI